MQVVPFELLRAAVDMPGEVLGWWGSVIAGGFQVAIAVAVATPFGLAWLAPADRRLPLLAGVVGAAAVAASSPWAASGALWILGAGLLAAGVLAPLRPALGVLQNSRRGGGVPARTQA